MKVEVSSARMAPFFATISISLALKNYPLTQFLSYITPTAIDKNPPNCVTNHWWDFSAFYFIIHIS